MQTVKQYLESLKWDGVKRVDQVVTEVLGAKGRKAQTAFRTFLKDMVGEAIRCAEGDEWDEVFEVATMEAA